jgi:hypothetical protein
MNPEPAILVLSIQIRMACNIKRQSHFYHTYHTLFKHLIASVLLVYSQLFKSVTKSTQFNYFQHYQAFLAQ